MVFRALCKNLFLGLTLLILNGFSFQQPSFLENDFWPGRLQEGPTQSHYYQDPDPRVSILSAARTALGWEDTGFITGGGGNLYIQHQKVLGGKCSADQYITENTEYALLDIGGSWPKTSKNETLTETSFHSYKAALVTKKNDRGKVTMKTLVWSMDGENYKAIHSIPCPEDAGTVNVEPFAEALFAAAMKQKSADRCNGVKCVPDYCSEDGLSRHFDCSCDLQDGKCYCDTEACAAGCNLQSGKCNQPQDKCKNVSCAPICKNSTSYSSGVCDSKTGNCAYGMIQDCGKLGCNTSTGLCNTQSDLSIQKVAVLQAVEGGMLVARKPTAVVVFLNWPDKERQAQVEVSLLLDGERFSTFPHLAKAEYSAYEKINVLDKVIFHIPPEKLPFGEHEFHLEARVVQDGMVDPDLSNNSKSQKRTFILSRNITLLLAYTDPSIEEKDIWRFYNRARPFLLDVYPVEDVSVVPQFFALDPNEWPSRQIALLESLREICNAGGCQARGFVDYGAGLFPDGFHGKETFGFSYTYARRSVLVGDGSKNSLAHEALAHEIGHGLFSDEYSSSNLGIPLPGDTLIYHGQEKQVENLQYAAQASYYNFMGIAGFERVWVNQETWDAMVRKYALQKVGIGNIKTGAPVFQVEETRSPGFLLSGTISREDHVEVTSLLAFDQLAVHERVGSDYWVEAFGKDDILITEIPLELDFTAGDPSPFVVTFPIDPLQAGGFNIVHKGKIIWQKKPSPAPPEVSFRAPPAGVLSGSVNIQWQAKDPDQDALTYVLLYSRDDGGSWFPLAAGLESMSYKLDTERLPGCEHCRLRILASDGWYTVFSTTATGFTVQDKRPNLEIAFPENGAQLTVGVPVNLKGFAYDKEDGWISGEEITWASDRDGPLGKGNNLIVEGLSAGRHTITASTLDDSGHLATASITVTGQGGNALPDSIPWVWPVIFFCSSLFLVILIVLLVVLRKRMSKLVLSLLIALCILGCGCVIVAGAMFLSGYMPMDGISFFQPTPRKNTLIPPTVVLRPSQPFSPTATRVPKIKPTSTKLPDRQEVYNESFEKKSNWPEKITDRYTMGRVEGGAYQITFWDAGDEQYVLSLQPHKFTLSLNNVALRIVGEALNQNGAYGLFCRYVDSKNFYTFHISTDGRYWLYKRVGGKWINMGSGTSPAIKPENTVEMRCINDRIIATVNQTILVDLVDISLEKGKAGLFAQPLGGPLEGPWSYYAVFKSFDMMVLPPE